MKKQHLAFAKKHAHWTTEQRRKVMFSIESNFQVFKMGSTTVQRPRSSDCFEPQYTMPTVKHLQSVMVLGCFSGEKGRGGLYFLPKNKKMIANLYLQVLEDYMLNFYNIRDIEMFMHDSAPCHKARKVTRYLKQKQINILEWPGNSPDLNPIKNYWHKIKKTMSEKKSTNPGALKEELKEVWCQEMTTEYFRNLSDSITKRLQMVIKNKGNMTKY